MTVYRDRKYSYNDIVIEPAVVSSINHRDECKVLDDKNMLPIFASPMSSVVSTTNFELFYNNHITPILPRNYSLALRTAYAKDGSWVAFGLTEFRDLFLNPHANSEFVSNEKVMYILIDIANGHMKSLYETVAEAKEIYNSKMVLMIGNIANPLTYIEAAKAGADYVRLSVGTGSCCITSTQLGVHYPIASLINDTYLIKQQILDGKHGNITKTPYIVADGGIRDYSDVIKALALGADFVMIGGVFASLIESAAPLFLSTEVNNKADIYNNDDFRLKEENGIIFNEQNDKERYHVHDFYKVMYGMASKSGQMELKGCKSSPVEGIKRKIPVTTNLYKWANNMMGYLQSSMSYCNIKEINKFNPMHVDCNLITQNAYNAINK